MKENCSRRDFIHQSATGTAGLLAGGYLATAKGYAENETINIGCIGTGGRCRYLMRDLNTIPGVKLAAVCDVWDTALAAGQKLADEKAVVTKKYEEVLERDDIDAVLIGTSDHWHVPIAIAACQAGKDVYVEKPLTHKLEEGEAIIRAQKESGRIVQVGMQQRSMPHLIEARKLFEAKELGEVCKVHLTWNRNMERSPKPKYNIDPASVDWKRFLGNAPDQPFNEYRYRNWRWFWDFGGGIFTDLMVHYLDVANWFLDLDAPVLATSIGDHFSQESLWETPDTVQTLLQYDKPKVQVYFEGTFSNARNAAMMEFMGSKATLYADRGRYEVHPERNSDVQYSELILGEGGRGADFYSNPNGGRLHLINWLECIRSRKQPNAPVEAGVRAAAAAHRANRSLRENAAQLLSRRSTGTAI
jgi:predicted dehydrogenase